MQEFHDELGTTASGAAIIIGDRDETRLNNMVTLADGPDSEDVTTFQQEGNAKAYAYLLNSGTVAVKGFLAADPEVVKAQLAQVLGKSRAKPLVIVGKYGLAPGTEANFARALSNTHSANHSLTGVTSADATMALTGTGIVDGVSLHRVFGDTAPGQSEVQKLVFTNADPNVFRGLRAVGTTEVFPFSFATNNAALSAGIAALPAYAGRVVTVTGDPLTGATLKSGERRIAFDGAVDVPQLEFVSGFVESLAVANGVGNYTLNGGAPFQPGVTEGALQTNQQNLGGARQGVVVKGASVANTGAGKTQVINGSGGAISIGGVAVDLTTPEPVNTLVGRIKTANPSRSTLTGIGNITKATAGADLTNTAGIGKPVGRAKHDFGDDEDGSQGFFIDFFDNSLGGDPAIDGPVGYVGYLFNANQTFNAVTAYWSTNSSFWPTNFRIQSSANGTFSDATTLYTNTVRINATGLKTYPVATTTARAVRIIFDDNQIVQIREMEIIGGGAPASANITLKDSVNAGNQPDLPIVGAGYASASTAANPNGSANFKTYYPLNAAPGAPNSTGQNAVVARAPDAADIAAATIQRSTGLDANFSYNFVNASDAGEWIDYQLASPDGFHLVTSVLEATGDNASLQIIVETADADNAGAPVPASIVALHQFAPFTARGYSMISETTPVKRLIRVRYVVTGGEFVFAVALAPR